MTDNLILEPMELDEKVHTVTLHGVFEARQWAFSISDTADGQSPTLSVVGTLTIDELGTKFLASEQIDLGRLSAHVDLVPRGLEVKLADDDDDDETRLFGIPKEPIGKLKIFTGSDEPGYRYDASIWIRARIDPEHFRSLRDQLANDMRMPDRLSFVLPNAKVQGFKTDTVNFLGILPRRVTFAPGEHPISRVSWRFGDKARQKFPSDYDEIGKLLRSQENPVIKSIEWAADGWMLEHDQCRRIAGELLASALLISTEDQLRARAYEGWRIAVALYDGLLQAERNTREQRTKPGKNLKRPGSIPWKKHSLDTAFSEGRESQLWSGIVRDDIYEAVQSYLTSGLDSPTFEWVAADALVYAEAREYGEHIKATGPGLSWLLYGKYSGNMLRMLGARVVLWLVKAVAWLAFPAWWALSKWNDNKPDQAIAIIVGWVALTAAWPLLRRLWSGDPTYGRREIERKMALYQAMNYAYQELYPDRPARVPLHALQHAQTLGALWQGEVWSLLIRADQRDPVFWTPPDRDREHARLASGIAWTLREEYDKRVEAKEIVQPDL